MRKALILSLLLMYFVCYSEASQHTFIQGIRYSSYKSYTRVVVDINGAVEFKENRLFNPPRIFFDLKNCRLSGKVESVLPVGDGVLKSIRTAQYEKDTVRVVLDIDKLEKYYSFMLEDPNRLVIDIYSTTGESPPEVSHNNGGSVESGSVFKKISTVVIDPGHGGKDPGAIGPRGLREKDITLSVSKELGIILEKKYDLNVVYTRSKDVFVPLNQRTHVANAKKADLFVSVHVNASDKRNARGIETYFLNWTNNREAIRVAARENRVSIKKMEKIQDSTQFILQDLARKNKNEESMRLAHSVQNSMINLVKKEYNRVDNLGVKYALFYVLIGAEMPSILVEVSFISNHDEEKRLSTKAYRKLIADAIAQGIDAYINQSTLIVKPDTNIINGG